MSRLKWYILLLSLGVIIALAFSAHKFTEQEMQVRKLNERYQIYPVPIPSNLNFAGEAVPLRSFEVKERIDRELLVNTYWQSNTMLILKRTRKYFAIIEPILESHGIPDDFKYLAVTESGLQHGTSSAGAKGFWQFIDRSAKYYGLNVDDQVDERYHLVKSTEAACKYLKEAYAEFGNWTLAAASYNRGITGIRNAMESQKAESYYDLHLNSETARYIPRVLAFKSIIENPSNYGFVLEPKDYYSNPPTRSVVIDSGISDLATFAKKHGSNYHVVKSLNPWILSNNLEVEKSITIQLPAK